MRRTVQERQRHAEELCGRAGLPGQYGSANDIFRIRSNDERGGATSSSNHGTPGASSSNSPPAEPCGLPPPLVGTTPGASSSNSPPGQEFLRPTANRRNRWGDLEPPQRTMSYDDFKKIRFLDYAVHINLNISIVGTQVGWTGCKE